LVIARGWAVAGAPSQPFREEVVMGGLGKQAKVLTDRQVSRALGEVSRRRYPERDRVMVLLSVRAGLRAKEIANVTWGMVTDAEGNVGDALHLANGASKGKKGGRTVPLNKELRAALIVKVTRNVEAGDRIIHSERDLGMSAGAVQVWFHRLYKDLGFEGTSSHSGRRTFVTRCAKNIVAAGGSLRDVQELAGHASLATTQRYIQGDSAAKRRVVDL
jgi:integrase